MVHLDCDFHIHSRFSAATSKNMNLENISQGALQKGLHVVGTGDCLNKYWLDEIETLGFKDGVGSLNGCNFILTTEVEDRNRVHHLLMFKDLESIHALRDIFGPLTPDMDHDGRPHTRMNGEEIAKACHQVGALIGPSHAFVPWTSIYKEYDSLQECYGEVRVDYLELGLSADTYLANRINELKGITFLSNSDAHSPSPHRLGREFNRLNVEKTTYQEIRKALCGLEGRGIVLNVGLDPRLGKYHRTSCIKCYAHYSTGEAEKLHWRCPKCKGRIKKGVLERISELEDYPGPARPRYLRIAPLAEIITKTLGVKSPYSKRVMSIWTRLVDDFDSEISVLVDAPIEAIAEIDKRTSEFIDLYRRERFTIIEGGGGRYGEMIFEDEGLDERPRQRVSQSSLDSY